MAELFGVFCLLGFTLVFVTLLGHGIWVGLAAVVRAIAGPVRRPPLPGRLNVDRPEQCPHCGATLASPAPTVAQGASVGTKQVVELPRLGRPAASAGEVVVAEVVPGGPAAAVSNPQGESLPRPTFTPVDGPAVPFTVGDLEAVAARRAKEYAARVEAAAAAEALTARDRETTRPAPSPAPRSKPLAKLLSAFMEERNIRWGEIVGGLLIVGCSIALVRSFWAEIAARPLLKFGVFNGITAAMFGVGLYTQRRWKLPHTTQGLLTIAVLLVPLNFLAIAAFAEGSAAAGPVALAGEAASIGVFAWLTYLAGRTIGPRWLAALVLGVLGPSLGELLVRRFAGPTAAPIMPWLLAALPLACYAGATGWVIKRSSERTEFDDTDANPIFRTFGAATFASVLCFGLLAARLGDLGLALQRLAPIVGLFGGPALAMGLFLWRRASGTSVVPGLSRAAPRATLTTSDVVAGTDRMNPVTTAVPPDRSHAVAQAGTRTAGTALAVCGAVVLVGGIVAAWPDPANLLASALAAGIVLAAVAVRFDLPMAHGLAACAIVVAYLVGANLVAGHLDWHTSGGGLVRTAMLSAFSGQCLVALTGALACAGAACAAIKRRGDAAAIAVSAAGVAALSLALVSWHGLGVKGDPAGVAWVYGIYAAAALAFASRRGHASAAWAGAALSLVAAIQAHAYRWPGVELPWLTGFLTHATLMVAVATASRWINNTAGENRASRAWIHTAAAVSAAAAAMIALSLLGAVPGLSRAAAQATSAIGDVVAGTDRMNPVTTSVLSPDGIELGPRLLWLAAIWLGVACGTRSYGWFCGFQAALALGVARTAGEALHTSDAFLRSPHPWLDPWTLQAQGITLCVIGLVWTATRRAARRFIELETRPSPERWNLVAAKFLWPTGVSVDRVVNFVVLGGLIAIAIYGVAPGVAQELSPKYGVTEVVAAGQSTAVAAERSVPTLGRFELLGVPHGHALGLGSWLLLAAVLTVLAAGLWEEFRSENVLGILATVMTSAAFVAGPWERDVSAASALRWTCALALAAGSLPIWFRGPLSRIAKNFNWPGFEARSVGLASESRSLVLVLSLAPLVAMAGYCAVAAVARVSLPTGTYQLWYVLLIAAAIGCGAATAIHFALGGGPRRAALLLAIVAAAPVCALSAFMVTASLRQSPILGPDPSSFFAQIGTAASYSLPVLVTAVVLLGHAIRERSARFAFVSGLLFNAAATSGYLLIIARGARLDVEHWIRLAQINAAVSAIYALAWFIARRRSEPAGTHSGGVLFATQSMLGAAFVAMAVAPLSLMFWADPWANPNYLAAADGGGWSAFGLALAALVACSRTGIRQMSRSVAVPAVWVAGTLLAFAASRWDTGNWAGFHVWMIVNLAIAWSVLGFGLWLREPGAKFGVWGSLIVGLVVMLALRSAVGDPQAPWWAVGSLAVLCVWSASFAGLVRQRAALYAAAILVNLAIAIWWFDSSWSLVSSFGPMAWSFFALNTLAAGLAAVIWTAIEVLAIRPFKRPVGIECHRVVATGGLLVVALHVGIGLLLDAFGEAQPADTWLDWLAWSGVAAAVVASLWDERARFRIAACYVLGLLAVGTALDQFNVPPRLLGWNVAMLLAAWSVGTSYLWSRRRGLTEIAAAVRMPRGPDTPTAGLIWLAPANLALAIGVVGLALWVDLTFFDELSLRLLSAKAAVAQALAVGLLARGERRSPLQYTALSLGAVGAVIWGWAWLEPGSTGILLDRAVVVIAALAATIALYGLGLAKLAPRAGEWTRAALRLVPVLAVLAAASIVVVIGMEIVYWLNDGAVPMSPTGIATVIAALAGLISAALAAAVLPGRDPLGLSERGRMAYVYAAEVVGGLLFLHIRLTMPWLFHGWFTRYWPLVVMAVAFAGVGFGEVFRRQRQRVLAEPLERTGVFLPLLPVLGFAVLPSLVDYSVLLLSVAVLYTGMAATRKSFVYSVLAALAANGSLWSLLWDVRGLRFLEHPQLWLIPPALCVLVAAWLNRDRLSAGQMATIRYAASTTIYVSSTADIFLNGVAQAPWLPVVLAGISLVGIFAGILLRVRGFLFLGTAFLSVALFTIIWHAAVDLEQTWLWFASGIAVGILIIALFAVFEQKRQEVLRLVDDLKRWQA